MKELNIYAIKALEIIKKKEVDVLFLMNCKTIEEYNNGISGEDYGFYVDGFEKRILTKQEFDLLKEVLL